MKVVLSRKAVSRIEEIEDLVAERNPVAAERLRNGLLDRMATLARLPRRGHALPELPHGPFRELLQGRYRIVYRIVGETAEVVTVFQGRRQLPREDLP